MQKTKLLLNILALFLCILPAVSMAQGGGNVTVSGIVTSADDKQPLIGVNVISGATSGVSTLADGTYRITVSAGTTLTFQYIGYKPFEFTVPAGRSSVTCDVALQGDSQTLDDVVVIAYGVRKKGTIAGKGVINNQMTNRLMAKMEKAGIPTHFVEELSERDTLVKKVSIVPLEVIIRNISAGHFASRYGVEEGIVFSEPTIEFSYKNDDLHDPLMNAYHAVALKLATWEEIELIKKYAFAVNDTLKAFWSECGVTLVDFKLEFGKTVDGQIVLADEISPDTCRLWDAKTHEKLDKDRFRRDLGGVEDAYAEIMKRLEEHLK